jgi:uncharacterized membrane protein YhaH (DUF805 family)
MGKYFNFAGYASRQQYWAVLAIVFAASFVVSTILTIVMVSGSSGAVIGGILMLAAVVVGIWLQFAVGARRCRDAGINPWWVLTYLLPYVNIASFIVIGVLKTEQREMLLED